MPIHPCPKRALISLKFEVIFNYDTFFKVAQSYPHGPKLAQLTVTSYVLFRGHQAKHGGLLTNNRFNRSLSLHHRQASIHNHKSKVTPTTASSRRHSLDAHADRLAEGLHQRLRLVHLEAVDLRSRHGGEGRVGPQRLSQTHRQRRLTCPQNRLRSGQCRVT